MNVNKKKLAEILVVTSELSQPGKAGAATCFRRRKR